MASTVALINWMEPAVPEPPYGLVKRNHFLYRGESKNLPFFLRVELHVKSVLDSNQELWILLPTEESVHESNEELDQDKEQEEHRRKRKRKKRKPAPHQDSGQDGAAPGQRQTVAAVEGGEHISRNKKRKLKKKRHKEKLLSMGVAPRAAALEFTYQKDGGKEEEEEDSDIERRAAEVSDFLRTTLEIYLSDRKYWAEAVSPMLPLN